MSIEIPEDVPRTETGEIDWKKLKKRRSSTDPTDRVRCPICRANSASPRSNASDGDYRCDRCKAIFDAEGTIRDAGRGLDLDIDSLKSAKATIERVPHTTCISPTETRKFRRIGPDEFVAWEQTEDRIAAAVVPVEVVAAWICEAEAVHMEGQEQ